MVLLEIVFSAPKLLHKRHAGSFDHLGRPPAACAGRKLHPSDRDAAHDGQFLWVIEADQLILERTGFSARTPWQLLQAGDLCNQRGQVGLCEAHPRGRLAIVPDVRRPMIMVGIRGLQFRYLWMGLRIMPADALPTSKDRVAVVASPTGDKVKDLVDTQLKIASKAYAAPQDRCPAVPRLVLYRCTDGASIAGLPCGRA